MERRERLAGESLRRHGLRLTPQRTMILAAVESQEGHFSAEDVYSQVRARYPGLHISTVYRTLDLLERQGLVTRTDLGEGQVQYHWAEKGHHHHLVCRRCGAICDLDEAVVDAFQQGLAQQYGFKAHLSHLAIFGDCARCQGPERETRGK